MSPDSLKLNIAKYGDKYHKNFPNIETFNYFCSMDRNIQYYKNYFIDFYNALDSATQRKLAYVIQYVKTESRWNEKFVKFIRDGLFELRAMHNGNIYRVFFILDEGNIIILFNGFQKKTQKTPKQEIEKAIKLKNQYYAEKQ